MGAACEHFLYDKGYGPTNLSLKHYVGGLFPEAVAAAAALAPEGFPYVEPTLLPIADSGAETRARDRDRTPAARRHEYTVVSPPRDGGPSSTLAAGASPRPRRIKTRIRPR